MATDHWGMERRASREPALVLPKPERSRGGSRRVQHCGGRAGRPALHQKNSAFLYCHVFLWVNRTDVIGARTDQPVIVELFDDVRGPSANSRDCEDGGEQVHVDA